MEEPSNAAWGCSARDGSGAINSLQDYTYSGLENLAAEDQSRAFVARLWGGGSPPGASFRLVRHPAKLPPAVPRIWTQARTAAAAEAQLEGGDWNSVSICAFVNEDTGPGRVCNARALAAFVVDLDYCEGEHARDDYPSKAVAEACIHQLPLPPTWVIDTGGGFHLWFVLKETWVFGSEGERRNAEHLSWAIQACIRRMLAADGYSLDETAGLHRSWRLPGVIRPEYGVRTRLVAELAAGAPYDQFDLEEAFCVPGLLDSSRIGGRRQPIPPEQLPEDLHPLYREALVESDSGGIQEIRDNELSRLNYVRTRVCPECRGKRRRGRGRDEWTAIVLAISGRLRCYRSSCDAAGEGLAFREWAPPSVKAKLGKHGGYAAPCYTAKRSTADPDAEPISLEEARRRLPGLLREAIEWSDASSVRLAVVCIPVGVGKTRAAISYMGESPDTILFSRTHGLLDEIESELRKPGATPVHLRGVSTACHYSEGLKASGHRCDWRSAACKGCPDRQHCDAWLDLKSGEPVLAPVQYLDSLSAEQLDGKSIIVDEPARPIDSWVFNLQDLANLSAPQWPAELCQAANCLREALQAWVVSSSTEIEEWCSADLIDAASCLLEANWPTPESEDLREGSVDPAEWPSPDLRKLLEALVEWSNDSHWAAIWVEARKIHARLVRPYLRSAVLLDATGMLTRAELQAANPDAEVRLFSMSVKPETDIRCVRIQTWAFGKSRIVKDLEAAVSLLARVAFAAISAAGRQIGELGIIARKVLAREFIEQVKASPGVFELTGPTTSEPGRIGLRVGWYFAHSRGENQFKDVDCLIVAGDPIENLEATRREAQLLGMEEEEAMAIRAAVEAHQALGRIRPFEARANGKEPILVYAGQLLPPDWGTLWEFERHDPPELPGNSQSAIAREMAKHLLCTRGWSTVDELRASLRLLDQRPSAYKGTNKLEVASQRSYDRLLQKAQVSAAKEVGAEKARIPAGRSESNVLYHLPDRREEAIQQVAALRAHRAGRPSVQSESERPGELLLCALQLTQYLMPTVDHPSRVRVGQLGSAMSDSSIRAAEHWAESAGGYVRLLDRLIGPAAIEKLGREERRMFGGMRSIKRDVEEARRLATRADNLRNDKEFPAY